MRVVTWLSASLLVAAAISATPAARAQQQSQQAILGNDGSAFMEEMPNPKATPRLPTQRLPIDLTNVNVPVDPNGNIVPLINKEVGPVLPFYSSTTQTFEPIGPVPGFTNPYPYYGYPRPGYGGFNYGGFANPNQGWPRSFGWFAPRPLPFGPGPAVNPGWLLANPWFAPPVVAPPPPGWVPIAPWF